MMIFLIVISIVFGVIGSTTFGNIRLSLLDVVSVMNIGYLIFSLRMPIGRLIDDPIYKTFLIFAFIAFLSLILTPLDLTDHQRLESLLYILRLLIYSSFYWTGKIIQNEDYILKGIAISGIFLAIIGWIQYFFYPDLRNLYYLGWDPHYKRIFSTFLDPNFLGIYLIIALITIVSRSEFIYSESSLFRGSGTSLKMMFKKLQHDKIKLTGVLFLIITILFTYSRSSIFVLGIIGLTSLIHQNKKILILPIILLFSIILFLLPRPGGEGVKLERLFTIEQRLDHARIGIEIFQSYPILGVGFNTLRYAKSDLGNPENWMVSHAGAGLDNSYLYVLATTGIAGFAVFTVFTVSAFRLLNFTGKLIFAAVLIHSLFVNSFFFPYVMAVLWLVLGSNTDHSADLT